MSAAANKKNLKARKIVQAGLKLFTNQSYNNTSIEQISLEAGIGKSTVYEYYKSKEELFMAVIFEAMDRWVADLESVGGKTRDPLERLQLIANRHIEMPDSQWQSETRLIIDVLQQTVLMGGIFYDRPHLIQKLHQRILRIVVDYLLAGVSRGQIAPGIARNAEKIAINFLAYLDGILIHGLIGADYIDIREQIAFFMQQMAPMLQAPSQG